MWKRDDANMETCSARDRKLPGTSIVDRFPREAECQYPARYILYVVRPERASASTLPANYPVGRLVRRTSWSKRGRHTYCP
jgi:hypothetical protein